MCLQHEYSNSCHSYPFPPEQLSAVCSISTGWTSYPTGTETRTDGMLAFEWKWMAWLQKSPQLVTLSLNNIFKCKTQRRTHGAKPGRKLESRSHARLEGRGVLGEHSAKEKRTWKLDEEGIEGDRREQMSLFVRACFKSPSCLGYSQKGYFWDRSQSSAYSPLIKNMEFLNSLSWGQQGEHKQAA